MSTNKIFPILVIGFSKKEYALIRSICLLATSRDRSYLAVQRNDDPLAEIVLVNGDETEAVQQSKSTDLKCQTDAPRLYIGEKALLNPRERIVYRPFSASRLLAALDKITVKDLHYFPELVIGDEATEQHKFIAAQFASQYSGRSNKNNYTALVVDDSRAVRDMIKIELDLLGVNSELAETGEQGLELLKKSSFDIVFLDITLPAMDGYQVCKTIKTDSQTRHIPVCMLTGKTSQFNKIKGKMAGCDSYLTKPVQAQDFLNVVNKLIPKQRLGDADITLNSIKTNRFAQEI